MRNLLRPLAALCLAVTPGAATLAEGESRPNIVLFLADDLGVRDTGFGGSGFYLTPHADALAERGVTFTQAYAAHPRCVPSRYGLLTGRYPARVGSPGNFYGIDRERQTVAETLRDAGYGTYFLGKWHLAGDGSGDPDEHGFDVNVAGGEAGAPTSHVFPYNLKEGKNGEKLESQTGGKAAAKEKPIEGLDDGEPGEMLTDRLTAEAEALLREHRAQTPEKPFFLMLSHYGVHTPLEDTREATRTFRKRLKEIGEPEGPEFLERDGETKLHQDHPVYAAMVQRLDDSLGSLVATLDGLGLSENTIFVFTSDHGGLSNRGNNRKVATSNLPYRAGKGHLYDGGLRVPLVVSWPGRVAPGSTSDFVTVGTDLHATFAALADADAPDDLDSASLAPVLTSGEAGSRGPVFWHSPRGRPASTGDHNASAVRDGDWKLIRFYDNDFMAGHDQLYDLAADPSEDHDLAAERPEQAAELRATLDAWLAEVDAVGPKVPANQRKKLERTSDDG